MAVLTLVQTLQAARVVVSPDNIPASITATAQPIYDGALQMINSYADDAPDAAKNLALERLFGYLWEVERTGSRASTDPLIQSGAASVLNRWRTRRAGAILPTTGTEPPGGGLTEAEVDRLIEKHVHDASHIDQDTIDGRIDVILDAAIPQSRRLPPFDRDNAGDIVQVNQDGTRLEYHELPDAAAIPCLSRRPPQVSKRRRLLVDKSCQERRDARCICIHSLHRSHHHRFNAGPV